MSRFQSEALGYAGGAILAHGDVIDNFRGIAIQSLDDTTTVSVVWDTTSISSNTTINAATLDETYTPSGGAANTAATVVDGSSGTGAITLKAGGTVYLPFTKVTVSSTSGTAGKCIVYRRHI